MAGEVSRNAGGSFTRVGKRDEARAGLVFHTGAFEGGKELRVRFHLERSEGPPSPDTRSFAALRMTRRREAG